MGFDFLIGGGGKRRGEEVGIGRVGLAVVGGVDGGCGGGNGGSRRCGWFSGGKNREKRGIERQRQRGRRWRGLVGRAVAREAIVARSDGVRWCSQGGDERGAGGLLRWGEKR